MSATKQSAERTSIARAELERMNRPLRQVDPEIAEILDPVSMTEPQYPKDAAKRRDDITGKK